MENPSPVLLQRSEPPSRGGLGPNSTARSREGGEGKGQHGDTSLPSVPLVPSPRSGGWCQRRVPVRPAQSHCNTRPGSCWSQGLATPGHMRQGPWQTSGMALGPFLSFWCGLVSGDAARALQGAAPSRPVLPSASAQLPAAPSKATGKTGVKEPHFGYPSGMSGERGAG